MQTIRLQNDQAFGVTTLPNDFIDRFMPEANGEFVKIYVYMFRLAMDPSASYSLSDITDKLECTSRDILRAFKYWSRKGLLEIKYSEDKEIESLSFLPIPASETETGSDAVPALTAAAEPDPPAAPEPAPKEAEPAADMDDTRFNAFSNFPDRSVSLAPARIRSLKSNSEIKQLLFVAEQYMEHPLNSSEIETILYFYDELHFSADLLDYLIEYCVSRGCKGIRYISKVGFAWADSGVTTVKEAKQNSKLYTNNCYAIMKAFGLGSRDPGTAELEYIHTWLSEYPASKEIILEAVNRTMTQIHKPQFSYTDSILRTWIAAGVKTIADIDTLDKVHSSSKTTRKNTTSRKTAPSSNSFNNFTGRDYDYSDLEKRLLDTK